MPARHPARAWPQDARRITPRRRLLGQVFCRVGWLLLLMSAYRFVPGIVLSFLGFDGLPAISETEGMLSEEELVHLSGPDQGEDKGHAYSRSQYLGDFRDQQRDIDRGLAQVDRFNSSWECGNIIEKVPLLARGGVGAQESGLIQHISTNWIFQYNDYIRYSHMAMIEQWGEVLVSAWQASPSPRNLLVKADGTKEIVVEGLQEQRILYSVSKDLGRTWGHPFSVQLVDFSSPASRGAVWGPVLHSAQDGRLWLFYSQSLSCTKTVNKEVSWSPGGDIKAIALRNVKSLTVGLFDSSDTPSWSLPRVILSQQAEGNLPKVVANKLIVLSTGEWLLPFWREKPDSSVYSCVKDTGDIVSAGVLMSADEGHSWDVRGTLQDLRSPLLEGTVVELGSGNLLMLLRSTTGCSWRSVSKDRGATWSQAQPTRIPNPNSKIHVIKLEPSGHLVLAFNNHKKQGTHLPDQDRSTRDGYQCKACRTALHLALSTDEGLSWRRIASVDTDLTPGTRIHYPTLQQVADVLLVAYSKFFLYKDPGEWSTEQGIRLSSYNISSLIATPATEILRDVPSRQSLIGVLEHFISVMQPTDLERLKAGAPAR